VKAFLIGLWTLIASLGAAYAVAYVDVTAASGPKESKPSLEVQKTRVINVPMIAGGAVRGFIVAQFAYTLDPGKAKTISVPPDVFLLDEAFRKIYTDDHLDFHHLEKYDVGGLTTFLVAATNKRLGMNVVHDVLVQDFTFISKEESEK
jgi:hypothetical protein